jgi:hypothetical protein
METTTKGATMAVRKIVVFVPAVDQDGKGR